MSIGLTFDPAHHQPHGLHAASPAPSPRIPRHLSVQPPSGPGYSPASFDDYQYRHYMPPPLNSAGGGFAHASPQYSYGAYPTPIFDARFATTSNRHAPPLGAEPTASSRYVVSTQWRPVRTAPHGLLRRQHALRFANAEPDCSHSRHVSP